MKTKFRICVLSILVLPIFVFVSAMHAQNDAVSWSTFDMGFVVSSPSSNVAVKSAVGQSFVGATLLANTFIESGLFADTLLRGTVVAVKEGEGIPTVYALYQNYPNPFNPSTTIRFDLPHAGRVVMKLFNVLGQEVRDIVNEERDAGRHSILFNAASMASGVYFYRIEAGKFVETRKFILLR